MKTSWRYGVCGILALIALWETASASSSINDAHKAAYGANTGWINARGDGANGGVIGQAYCSGYMWSANCGWIKLGAGHPPMAGSLAMPPPTIGA